MTDPAAPAERTPAERTPAEQTPAEQTPAEQTPAERTPAEWLDQLLIHLWEHRGTDLLLTAGSCPLMRVDGDLHPIPGQPVLKPPDTAGIAESLLSPGDKEILKARGDVDFAFGFRQRAR